MRLATILTMFLAVSILFVTPMAAAHNSATDAGPEKIEQVECSSLVDVKCTAVNADIQIRNNLIDTLEANRGMAEDWHERGQEWEESNVETVENLGEKASGRAESANSQIDHQQELLRENTIPELVAKRLP
ncbi:hypothetical protein [Natrinema versiforme]|uniref:Uncharacterized protein n=1 Tax=Natrinema versiforme TaxID=88724 RepID=A0A4P8WRB5_9EURY|nr:hypothetical protein [Natrinema versiforme]QCS44671.1 hypothetical protein FEJ81_20415 [Natrinema versiforme]